MQARHGDVFIKSATIPADAEPQKDRTVIVEGESTGHSHRMKNQAMGVIYLLGAQMYLRALQAMQIIHEEHDAITLPPGDYEVKIQREMDPFGHIRQVMD